MDRPRISAHELRLYLIADPVFMRGKNVLDVVAEAAKAKIDVIQLREKSCSQEEFLGLAREFSEVLRNYSIPLVINDRIDIAKKVRAQGVHLGQNDLPWQEARRVLGEDAIIGVSVETFGQAQKLAASDIDYLGVSGVFLSDTKPDLKSPWGLEGVASLRSATNLPLVGVGGIGTLNAASVLKAGADGIAVVSAIARAMDPGAAAKKLRKIVDAAFEGDL